MRIDTAERRPITVSEQKLHTIMSDHYSERLEEANKSAKSFTERNFLKKALDYHQNIVKTQLVIIQN